MSESPTITSAVIAELARAAGASGRSWGDWCCDDVVQDYVGNRSDADADIDAWRAAFQAGEVEHMASQGWVSRWTTAPSDYDTFGTVTAETCGNWHAKPLRRVLCHPHHAGFQASRYSSGMHPTWDEDPRVEEQRAAERQERWAREDAERAERRATGLAWLAKATENEIEQAKDGDAVESRGLTYVDLRDELKRRADVAASVERASVWQSCRSAFADGAILVDDGRPGERGRWGWIPGRESYVYYGCRVEPHWAQVDDAERASVLDADGKCAGSLLSVASQIANGQLRIVTANEVPPAPVVNRIGHGIYREIRRVDCGKRTVWVGRPRMANSPLVLDESGRIVRARAVCEAAMAAYRSAGGW